MAIQIPIYERRAQLQAVPGYRQNIRDSASEALVGVGEGIARAGAGVGEAFAKAKESQDSAALMDAFQQLGTARQQLLDDPENGLTSQKGKNAIASRDSVVSFYDAKARSISDGLANEEQRKTFQNVIAKDRTTFMSSVDGHVAREADALAEQAYQGSLATTRSDAIGGASQGDYKKVRESIGIADQLVEARAKAQGWAPEFASAQKRQVATEVHLNILDSLVEKGDATGASFYLKEHRDEIDGAMLAKSNIEKAIANAGDSQTGAEVARMVAAASTTTAVRPWDKNLTPVSRIDPTKAYAELGKLEANPNVSENAKHAAREKTDLLVRTSEATWKGMLDDTYSRAITKLEQNGWQLSGLAQEKAYLLSKEVDGGATWEAIVGRRDQEMHRRSGAAATPAQHEAMVRFLVTLPDRVGGYIDPSNTTAFMSEWGPQLSVSDYEQAAGYVARSGMTAAKPDASLPVPVIARIKEQGAEAGLWGQKGPKSDDDNRRYLQVYNDLLTKQAELKRQNKPLDDKTVQDVMASWVAKGKVPGSGIIFDDTPTRVEYETSPKYQGKPFVEEIPDAFRKLAESKLKAAGQPASEEFIRYLYNKKAGVPDAQNPRPPDPRKAGPGESPTWGYPQP